MANPHGEPHVKTCPPDPVEKNYYSKPTPTRLRPSVFAEVRERVMDRRESVYDIHSAAIFEKARVTSMPSDQG